MEQQKQPKIVQKMLLRTFFLLLAVAGIFLGVQKVLDWRENPDSGEFDTVDSVAAIEILPEGQQAVIFDRAGKKTSSPGYETGKTDRDVTWRPDGNRIFFASDRKEGSYNLYRWNPAAEKVEQRSLGTINKVDPSFPPIIDNTDTASVDAAGHFAMLIQGGGAILEYDIAKASSTQLLPPGSNKIEGQDEGSMGLFDSVYGRLGTAFRSARWLANQEFIAAIIRRDDGEALIVQRPKALEAADQVPKILVCADKIDMDVDAKTGVVVFTFLNFQFPDPQNIPEQFIKNGKVVPPWVNGIFVYQPKTDTYTHVAASNELEKAFGPAAVSSDGTQIALTTGKYDGTSYHPAGLAVMPIAENGMESGAGVMQGEIYDVSWHPNKEVILYVRKIGSERAICQVGRDGKETKISSGGNYMMPKFSPQVKAPK